MLNIVIGASQGIGFETVKELLYQGHHVLAVSRSIDSLKELQKSFSALEIFQGDISNEKDMLNLSENFKEKRIISTLIITAGVLIKKEWKTFSKEDFSQVFDTNVFGVYNCVSRLASFFSPDGKRHIVTIGSMGGIQRTQKFPGMLFYSSSKAATSCITECLAEELKPEKIHINCVSLGAVETEMKKTAFPDYPAPHSATEIARFLVRFTLNEGGLMNGKTIELSVSTP